MRERFFPDEEAPVERVEVSVDDDRTWRVTSPGPVTLRSRAVDAAGHTQPASAEWNRLGYANNAIQVVHVTVA